jgi:hypothetical protein
MAVSRFDHRKTLPRGGAILVHPQNLLAASQSMAAP